MKSVRVKIENPVECTIVRRLNRFVVEVEISGESKLAWINNTGRLEEFLIEGYRGFCMVNRPGMKTSHRLFAIREGDKGAIIDTRIQTQAFENAVGLRLISWLDGYRIKKREVRLGDSVIDYLLTNDEKEVFLEVKSAVLRVDEYATYPDCPTSRGRRHVKELTEFQKSGGDTMILFMAALPGVRAFKPYREGDAELADLLIQACDAGVDIHAMGLYYDPADSEVFLYDDDLRVEV